MCNCNDNNVDNDIDYEVATLVTAHQMLSVCNGMWHIINGVRDWQTISLLIVHCTHHSLSSQQRSGVTAKKFYAHVNLIFYLISCLSIEVRNLH